MYRNKYCAENHASSIARYIVDILVQNPNREYVFEQLVLEATTVSLHWKSYLSRNGAVKSKLSQNRKVQEIRSHIFKDLRKVTVTKEKPLTLIYESIEKKGRVYEVIDTISVAHFDTEQVKDNSSFNLHISVVQVNSGKKAIRLDLGGHSCYLTNDGAGQVADALDACASHVFSEFAKLKSNAYFEGKGIFQDRIRIRRDSLSNDEDLDTFIENFE